MPKRIFPDWYMGFFLHEVDENPALSGLVNLYESNPASQFLVGKLLEVKSNAASFLRLLFNSL